MSIARGVEHGFTSTMLWDRYMKPGRSYARDLGDEPCGTGFGKSKGYGKAHARRSCSTTALQNRAVRAQFC